MDILRSSTFKKTNGLTDETLSVLKDEPDEDLIDANESKLNATMSAFKNLGQPCKQLLTDFYYDKKSLRIIASELQIEEASVRNKKYRCMEKLRNLVLSSKS